SGSTPCGVSPIRPSSTALSVPWPTPVRANEPNSSAVTEVTSSNGLFSTRKRRAATIGPTVCELDGPMPILNKSKTLMSIVACLSFLCLCGLAEAHVDICQHVLHHLFHADLRFPVPVRGGLGIVQAARPAVSDGLAAVRSVGDLKVRQSAGNRCRQFFRVEGNAGDIVRRTNLD